MAANPIFHRAELLLGPEALTQLQQTKVIIFGVGGVGSWCAEALVRTGITDLTIVDNDVVCITNTNRQLQATAKNVGKVKVLELKDRLEQINPEAKITACQDVYDENNRDKFILDEYDYVIDAIDSLSAKVDLIEYAINSDTTFYSAMGAACKIDATNIRSTSIWKTQGCPLARLIRNRMRKQQIKGDFLCVWSEEVIPSFDAEAGCGTGKCFCPKIVNELGIEVSSDVWCHKKAKINGSLAHVTGAFGFALSGLVIKDIYQKFPPAALSQTDNQ